MPKRYQDPQVPLMSAGALSYYIAEHPGLWRRINIMSNQIARRPGANGPAEYGELSGTAWADIMAKCTVGTSIVDVMRVARSGMMREYKHDLKVRKNEIKKPDPDCFR